METKAAPPRPARYAIVDATRGAAIVLMFVYHFSWDLTYFGFADFGIFTDWRWVWFARFIAGLILLVMGTSQVLARARGRTFTARSFFTRLAVICGAAALVSAATYMMDPRSYVFFGILRHVALASVLRAVVSQRLLPRVDGAGRCVAFEVMINNNAIGNLIRKNETNKIQSTIQTSRRAGMVTLDDFLYDLVQKGSLSRETALEGSQDPRDLEARL